MILIQSDNNDYSTNKVIDWLIHYKKKFCRLNGINLIKQFSLNNSNVEFSFHNVTKASIRVRLNDICSYWYRRGAWNIEDYNNLTGDHNAVNCILEFYKLEGMAISNYLNYYAQTTIRNTIGNETDNYLDKLQVLELARLCQLKVPSTIITTRKSDLVAFHKVHKGRIITKAIFQAPILFDNRRAIFAYTSLFNLRNINACPDFFYPTLFQKAIEKKFEVRAFFLDGKIFSTAIFSQNDKQTKIDFRNYNYSRPNRTPPFIIPNEIKKKICKLMSLLKMRTGSIDMIYSTKGDFYFLEVNPIGQFQQVSYPGNYYLEKMIAKVLCK